MENYGILLVDDEPVYRAIIAALLTTGCAVDCVESGPAAIAAAAARSYDLVLMDIELGGDIDGYRTAARLRSEAGGGHNCPIIAFTTLHPPAGEAYFIDRGFDGWLAKPFAAAELYHLMIRWLGWEAPRSSHPISRLADLLGRDGAMQMADRLHASLADAVARVDAGASPTDFAHRLGGLAGTLGYAPLGAGWLALQYGDGSGWRTVRELSLEAIAAHARLQSDRG